MIPEENVKDLAEIPDNVKNHLEIVPVRWIDKFWSWPWSVPEPLAEEEAVKEPLVAAGGTGQHGSGAQALIS